jgi:hypothetical protein
MSTPRFCDLCYITRHHSELAVGGWVGGDGGVYELKRQLDLDKHGNLANDFDLHIVKVNVKTPMKCLLANIFNFSFLTQLFYCLGSLLKAKIL